MKTHHITETRISAFEKALRREEKSPATVDKYLRDVRAFFRLAERETVTKERAIRLEIRPAGPGQSPTTINTKIAAVNHFLSCMDWRDPAGPAPAPPA